MDEEKIRKLALQERGSLVFESELTDNGVKKRNNYSMSKTMPKSLVDEELKDEIIMQMKDEDFEL